MTKEESIVKWNEEKSSVNFETLYNSYERTRKLFNIVDEYINKGLLMYDEFNNDIIDGITNRIISNTKNNINEDKFQMLDNICGDLIEKYNDKYKNKESLVGDK